MAKAESENELAAPKAIVTVKMGSQIVTRWTLSVGTYTLGALEENDLRVDFRGVSGRHGRIIVEKKGVLIEDVGSRYGTYLGGDKVTGPVAFTASRPAQIGDLTLEVAAPRPTPKNVADFPVVTLPRNSGLVAHSPPPPDRKATRPIYQKGTETRQKRSKLRWSWAASNAVCVVAILIWMGRRQFHHDSSETAPKAASTEEDKRGEATLLTLRRAAPAVAEQARILREEGNLDAALEKIATAIELDPRDSGFRRFRADVLEATQHLQDAAKEYRAFLEQSPGDVNGTQNLRLCERLIAENRGDRNLRPDLQQQLLDSLIAQKRTADAVPIAKALGYNTSDTWAALVEPLKVYRSQSKWRSSRLIQTADRTYALDLSDLKIADPAALSGLPISELNLARCNLQALPDLNGFSLRRLDLSDTHVSDLTPLRGQPLEELLIDNTDVTDLSPLAGLPLRELSLRGARIHSITALAGLPLKSLDLRDQFGIPDYSGLMSCKSLETLYVPSDANLYCLRNHPSLRLLAICKPGIISFETYAKPLVELSSSFESQKVSESPELDGPYPANEFWRKYEAEMKKRTAPALQTP